MFQVKHSIEIDGNGFNLARGQSKSFAIEIHFAGSFFFTATTPLTSDVAKSNPAAKADVLQIFSWKLSDPTGRTVLQSDHVVWENITMSMLDQVRDVAGYVAQPWTFHMTNTSQADFSNVTLTMAIYELLNSASAPPVLNGSSVSLKPGISQTLPFTLNQLGQAHIDVVAVSSAMPSSVQLLDPSGAVFATQSVGSTPGTISLVSGVIDLATLHQARKKGGTWAIRLTSGVAATCKVTVAVYDTLAIPSSVIQTRLNAILGANGKSLTISLDHDKVSGGNEGFACLTINDQNVVDFFDSLGIMDSLESQDRSLRTPPPPVPVDPVEPRSGTVYRIADLGLLTASGHNFYPKNVQTSSIRCTVGGPSNDSFCRLMIEIVFANNATLDINDAPDLEISSMSLRFDLIATWMPDTKHIAFVPLAPAGGALTVGKTNWVNSPDFLIDWIAGDPASILKGKAADALASLGGYLKTFTENLFYQLMGDTFDFTPNIQWKNQAFNFQFSSGLEPLPGTLNPYYHFGPPINLRADAAGSTASPQPASGVSINPKPNWQSPNLAKIDHIVVLMKENRSFDHVLGHLSLTEGRTDVDGLTLAIINSFPDGSKPRPYPLVPVGGAIPSADYFPFDPSHSFGPVANEINNAGGIPMHGFIPQFIVDYPWLKLDTNARKTYKPPIPADLLPFQPDAIMGYHTPATVSYYSELAKSYTVCDRWYSSHPGPTFPNRFFFLSGKLNAFRGGEPQRDNNISGMILNRQRTLFDELTARGITWTYYESPPDVSMLRMYARYAFDDKNLRPISEFFPRAQSGKLPSVTFIDPNFHYEITNDDHPPTSISGGQAIVKQVIDALQSNSAAWSKTLFVLTYDEHGSIFDHVPPPIAETIAGSGGKPSVSTIYGVRVPAIVVSPWVEKTCSHQMFDHCSILKTIIARFCPSDPPILSDRVAWSADLGVLLTRSAASEIIKSAVTVVQGVAASKPLASPPRPSTLSRTTADWHGYMARLSGLVKIPQGATGAQAGPALQPIPMPATPPPSSGTTTPAPVNTTPPGPVGHPGQPKVLTP